ncbi:MAG TPA: fused MFS/spermidine synthase, partial [Candidatus Polarisedimenticolaceae bacterium]|nr:fused MFS/spermidine synthase [Candidatus Polarisedimenticolaceae bacterium]
AAERPSLTPGLLLALYGLSGLAAMAYQVAWSRALILAMGSSTYAFSTIVACYIFGLALGSLLVSSAEARPAWRALVSRHTLSIAGYLQAAIGLSALLVVPLFGRMPLWVAGLARGPEATFSDVLRAEALIVFGLLFVPTCCMGALMPLVCRLYGRDAGPGRSMGDVYAANTIGTIVGAFSAGFVLIPLQSVGMQHTIHIASALSIAIGSLFLLGAERSARHGLAVVLLWIAGAATIVLGGTWAREVMVSGPFLARREIERSVLFYREGVDTTVAVTSSDAVSRTLRVNGKPDASNSFMDMVTQLMSAHIPLLLRPDAEQVLVIGLGSGATGGAVLSHPVERVDVAEISAAVVEAAAYFDAVNNGVLTDERVTIHREDGRNHLLLTDRRYDVIVSEPSNPWISGVANLFTREFFELALSRLRPGGLHCQWIQGYSIRAEDVAAVLHTLGSVFAHVQFWETGFGDYLVIGSEMPIELDLDRVYQTMALPEVALSLGRVLIQDPNQLAAHWIAGRDELEQWIGGQRVLTDDRPYLEFAAPLFLLGSDEARIRQALLEFDEPPALAPSAPPALAEEFRAALGQARSRRRAMHRLETAVMARDGGATLDGLLDVARWGATDARSMKRVDQMLTAIEAESNPALAERVGATAERLRRDAPYLARAGADRTEPATMYWPFTRSFDYETDAEAERLEAEILRAIEARDRERMMDQARRLLARAPQSWRALSTIGALLLDERGPEAARPYLLKAWIRNPASRAVGHRLAHVYAGTGRPDLAIRFVERSIANGLSPELVAADPGLAALRDQPAFRELVDGTR